MKFCAKSIVSPQGNDNKEAVIMNNSTTQKPAGSRYSTMSMVQVAIFGAIICIMAFTPFLGYIPLGFTRAFGLTSFINNTINPTATSFVFTPFYSVGEISGGIWSVIICFVPRILVGVVPYFVYKLVLRFVSEDTRKKGVSSVGLVLAGVSGALVNTLLVMNLIFVFYGDAYIKASGEAAALGYTFILSVIGINGVPEAIVAGILTLCIGKVLLKKNVRERLGF